MAVLDGLIHYCIYFFLFFLGGGGGGCFSLTLECTCRLNTFFLMPPASCFQFRAVASRATSAFRF